MLDGSASAVGCGGAGAVVGGTAVGGGAWVGGAVGAVGTLVGAGVAAAGALVAWGRATSTCGVLSLLTSVGAEQPASAAKRAATVADTGRTRLERERVRFAFEAFLSDNVIPGRDAYAEMRILADSEIAVTAAIVNVCGRHGAEHLTGAHRMCRRLDQRKARR
jgi:hypothetical protein